MEKSTYKTPLLITIVAVIIAVIYFLSGTIYALIYSPNITHRLYSIEKTTTEEGGCLITLGGNLEIDYRAEITEIKIEGKIEDSRQVEDPRTYTTQKNIENPGKETEFEIEIESFQKCDLLVNPEIEILSTKKGALQNGFFP